MTAESSPGGRTRTSRESRLAQQFVALADTLADESDPPALLDRLPHAVVDVLGTSSAGLLVANDQGRPQFAAASNEETRLLQLFQLQVREGPCLDCIATGTVVSIDDLPGALDRWPHFVRAAGLVGYTSVHSIPLRLRSELVGGLSLFRVGRPLDPEERLIAQAIADVATVGVLQLRRVHRYSLLADQLQQALDSRIVIEQAKGVLTAHGNIGMDEAYSALRDYSRNHNLKLRDVATAVATRTMPPADIVGPVSR